MSINSGGQQPDHWVRVRDGKDVPGIPPDMLKAVFDDGPVDAKLEQSELIFEYWNSSGIPRDYIAEYTLKTLQACVNRNNVDKYISLLVRRGVAADFFDLTRSDVDKNHKLREFLLNECGVDVSTISRYASFYAISPKLFADGFFLGLGNSCVAVAIGLVDMVKMFFRVNQEVIDLGIMAYVSPSFALSRMENDAEIVKKVFESVMGFINPLTIPQRVADGWKDWNQRFLDRLHAADPLGAGRVLGKIGGDLWQTVSGLIALGKLLQGGAALARKFAPLLLTEIRNATTAELYLFQVQVTSLLAALDAAIVTKLPRVGTAFLKTMFPPEVLKAIAEKGTAVVAYKDWGLIFVHESAYAGAYGMRMGSPFSAMISYQGRPLFMAALSESASVSGGVELTEAEVRAMFAESEISQAEINDYIDRAFPQPPSPTTVQPSNALTVERKVAENALLHQRMGTQLTFFIRQKAFEQFAKLFSQKGRIKAGSFGKLVHTAADAEIDRVVQAPGVNVFKTGTLTEFVEAAKGWDPRLAERFAKSATQGQTAADKLLGETVANYLYRKPELQKAMGIELKSAADAEKYVERFQWTKNTRIGNLEPDALICDTELSELSNIDFTSSTKFEKFAKTMESLFGDLKDARLSGNWEEI